MVGRRNTPRRGTPADLLVVGLGNPGDEYADTRHNAGVWVINELVRRHGGKLSRAKKEHAETAELRVGLKRLVVAVPTTYMNESGRAVGAMVRRHGIEDLSRLVIVHDELDLPVGRLKVKFGGGMAGNNGLKSIRDHLRADEFSRIRLGVGKPAPDTMKGADYVLRRPARSERPELARIVNEAADAVEHLLDADIEASMNRFNAS
ncbi:MAG: PTH1 family peptidyl-tRNA hydrolase [Candidatus Aldehydirespiratoraceae bacterium]|jgi:PTH1 family peptidyl-tRNA hydrolase